MTIVKRDMVHLPLEGLFLCALTGDAVIHFISDNGPIALRDCDLTIKEIIDCLDVDRPVFYDAALKVVPLDNPGFQHCAHLPLNLVVFEDLLCQVVHEVSECFVAFFSGWDTGMA